MNVLELKQQLATDLQDPAMQKVVDAQLLIFINKAARDLRNSGWYIPLEENESLTQTASTYVYNVPASFVFVSSIRLQESVSGGSVYDQEIPRHQWEIGIDGGAAIFRFDSHLWTPDVGRLLKVIGQKRPTIYTADTDEVDLGVESFLGERALSYAARMLSPGGSEMARSYAIIGEQSYRNSLEFLRYQPQQFRMDVDAEYVPGR